MKAVQAQRIHVMNVQSMHDWMSLKVGRTGKREVRAEHLNIGKSLPSLADTYAIAKAHCYVEHSAVIAAEKGKLEGEKRKSLDAD